MGSTVFFILMDIIPDYVQKTFGMNADGEFRRQDIRVVKMGGKLPKEMAFGVILFNDSEYHGMEAYELSIQIQAIFPSAKVLMIPVQG